LDGVVLIKTHTRRGAANQVARDNGNPGQSAARGSKAFLRSAHYFRSVGTLFLVAALAAVAFAPSPERGDHVMRALINVIRRLARLTDGGWLPLAVLGVVVFWMMHSA
jgi:hypothetical protein